MATEVDIANLALGYLGDVATVSSITPPEGSVQAGRCARFYPMARDQLIQSRNWACATRRATPAGVATTITQWAYGYALPANTLDVIAVMPPGYATSLDDLWDGCEFEAVKQTPGFQGVDFTVEQADDGSMVLYTNQPDATILYVIRQTNTNLYPPLMVNALARLLASMLAGPVLKGDAGRKESQNQMQEFRLLFSQADVKDANMRSTSANNDYVPSGVRSRA